MDRLSTKKQFALLGTKICAIRHAALSETRYSCLYLTEDTYDLFLRSTTTSQAKAVKLRDTLYKQVTDPVLVHARTLESLEQKLTGICRLLGAKDSLFYVSLSFSTFLSTTFDIIREIHVIAFARSLKGRFYRHCATLATETGDELILDFVQSLQTSSMAHQLEAAISRQRFVIRGHFHTSSPSEMSAVSDRIKNQQQNMDPEAELKRGERPCKHCEGKSQRVPHLCHPSFTLGNHIREAIQYIYRLCKKGSMEPEEPFLRISKSLDQLQHTGLDTKSPTSSHPDKLEASEDGYVLIWSDANFGASKGFKAIVCVYIVTENMVVPDRSECMGKAKRAFETVDVYHTIREYDKRRFHGAIIDPVRGHDWNLRNTYRVTTRQFDFYLFFCEGGSMEYCPVTQGSDRARHQSGSYVWQRNLCSGRRCLCWHVFFSPVSSFTEGDVFLVGKGCGEKQRRHRLLHAVRRGERGPGTGQQS